MKNVRKVIILGGGTAGWMAAAALSNKLQGLIDISLVESDAISTVGVGEATIPPLKAFHRLFGIDEAEFMRATFATFKLGISFENWGKIGEKYIHSFGNTGQESWMAAFQHFWLRGNERGIAKEYGSYCLEWLAASRGKFSTSKDAPINYAYHFDSAKYGQFLRSISCRQGVARIEGTVRHVKQNPDTGYVESLVLESGQQVDGDLFLDCTGFRSLLVGQTLHTGYEDWSHWLPCDRAVVAQSKLVGPAVPYTRSIAHAAGWRWRIPLQHREGNGLVYCSHYLDDESARQRLEQGLVGEALTDPRVIRYRTGRRHQVWNKNCIALGLSSGFVEPLESTSIHLFMTGITRLLQLFPFGGVDQAIRNEYNRQTRAEIEKIRDFIVLHYHVTNRSDSEFWRYCKNMEVPDSLKAKIELFRSSASVFKDEHDLFRNDSWTQVMLGQGIVPQTYHNIAAAMSDKELEVFLGRIMLANEQRVSAMPSHQDFVNQYCLSESR